MKTFYFRSLFIVLLIACCSVAKSESGKMIDGIYYKVIDPQLRTVEVTKPSKDYSGALVIPEKIVYNDEVYQVTRIGEYAFNGCIGLTNVTIPNSVTSIGANAFDHCYNLTSLEIPNSVTTIGEGAFYDCTALTSITIPNSVTSIGSAAFGGTAWYDNQPDGVVYAGKVLYKYKVTMPFFNPYFNTNITIKDGTLGIAGYAFYDCAYYRFDNIEIPNSVTNIGEFAFYGCGSLANITIPNSVTSIGSCAFDGTAWYNNQPDGPLYINNVFYKYKGTMPDNTNITIKDGTLEIAGYAFYDCDGLTGVTIPNSVKNIGKCAFNNCDNLTKIEIPNGVTTIGYNAFGSCMRLASVTIPNSVRSIGDMAFNQCVYFTEIYAISETPATLDYYTFSMTDISSATLYVPVGSKDAYLAADYWNEFGNIVEMDFTAIEDIPADDALHGVNDVYHDLRGRCVSEPTKGGIYIHNGKKVLF